jgi:hypothetical protein
MSDEYLEGIMAKRAEVNAWDRQLQLRAKQYRAQGMSAEEAEEKACRDIRREIRQS